MTPSFDLSDMALFAKVVEERSFTRAAQALGLPKSTISRRISQLEERLGARLLQRTTRSLGVTDVGAAYYRHCARVVREAELAVEEVANAQAAPRGLLRVTTPVALGTEVLRETFTAFLHAYPEVSLDLFVTDRVVDIVEEGFDLAIRVYLQLEESSLIARRLGPARMVLSASPDYLERRGVPTRPEDLSRHDCIVLTDHGRTGAQWMVQGRDGPVSVPISGRFGVNSMALAREAALAGLGVALLPVYMCREAIAAGRLRPLLGEWSPPEGFVYALYPSSRNVTPKVRAFIEFLVERLRERPPGLAGTAWAPRADCSADGTK